MSTIQLSGVELYYEDAGTGPALLLLHGLGTSGRVWGSQQAHFVRDHRVVTVDWRGCGRSERPATGNDYRTVTTDLAEFIDALGIERPTVVGSSIGAVFATELALARPELVGGVVAVDGPVHWAAESLDLRVAADRLRDHRAQFVGAWVPGWFADGVAPALVDWTVLSILDASAHLGEQFDALVGYDPRPRLGHLRVPIHYVHGELDSQVPLTAAVECAALCGDAQLSVVEGAGHLPHQEDPEQFNVVLRDALVAQAGHVE